MPRSSEEISNYNSGSSGRTDANLANDSNHLGGIPADEYATQEYVQRYHNTKEAAQKDYIDEKDSTGLNRAKAYTDLMINNQDFSGFAQKTDVLALQQDTANKLAQCQTTCANNLENTRQQIVSDVNAGFDDVGQSISQLNANQQQLFTSVSNGKAKVAAAITGKGVTTASDATYETMASNIRNIESGSGGGEVDPNYMNTSDATVNEGDIALGKTAYARGNKLYGTHVCEDSSDANAAASDILLGKSAYVNGEKVYGSLIQQSPVAQPTYGLDTTDATALASDVRIGKTFYARGAKIVGTAYGGEVEEIYGARLNQLTYDQLSGLGNIDELADVTISSRRLLKFSKDLKYCVCCSEINGATYIESYAINAQGIYIQGSTGLSGDTTYKKYRYSYSELGLAENEYITDLELTKPGLFGSQHNCLLIIMTRQKEDTGETSNNRIIYNYTYRIRLYNYNLLENGAIGKLYSTQSNVPEPYSKILREGRSSSYTINTMRVASFNTRNDKLFVIYGADDGTGVAYGPYTLFDITITNVSSSIYLTVSEYTALKSSSITAHGASNNARFMLTQDDRFAYFENAYNTSPLVYNDFSDSSNYIPKPGHCIGYNLGNILGTNTFINVNNSVVEVNFTEDYIPHDYIYKNVIISKQNFNLNNMFLSIDNKAVTFETHNYTNAYIRTYNVQDILNAENGDRINYIDELFIGGTYSGHSFISDYNSKILVYSLSGGQIYLYQISLEKDVTNIVGLVYNGNYYYRQDPHILTAGQPDVRAGKTFIGWMGTQETGTMEVE